MATPLLRIPLKDIPILTKSLESDNFPIEEKLKRIDDVIAWTDEKSTEMAPLVKDILRTRIELFNHEDTGFDIQIPLDDQLYEEESYNPDLVKAGLDHRKNAALGFHEIKTSYNDSPDDNEELKYAKQAIRSATLSAGQKLGFLPKEPGVASDALMRWLDMQDSERHSTGKVDAAIVAGAAGLSTISRFAETVNDIESGAMDTNLIIMATCSRIVREDEHKKLLDAGLHDAKTEFDECVSAAIDILGASFDEWGYTPVEYEAGLVDGFFVKAQVNIADKLVDIIVVDSPMDPARRNAERGLPPRQNTRETYEAAASLLPKDSKKIVVKSHDTWINYQDVIAHDTFELGYGLDVTTSGPRRSDRIKYVQDDNGNLVLDVNKAEEVIDEIAKVYQDLQKLKVKAITQREALLHPAPTWRDLSPEELRAHRIKLQTERLTGK
jgi:hypothetical protein